MGVNSLRKTVTRQRRGCNLNPGPETSAPEFSTLTTRLPSHSLLYVAVSSRDVESAAVWTPAGKSSTTAALWRTRHAARSVFASSIRQRCFSRKINFSFSLYFILLSKFLLYLVLVFGLLFERCINMYWLLYILDQRFVLFLCTTAVWQFAINEYVMLCYVLLSKDKEQVLRGAITKTNSQD